MTRDGWWQEKVRPEPGSALAPAEDDISESWLELCEGLWVVRVPSMPTVGELPL